MNNEKDAKLIFSPQLANFLLKKGYRIIKLKQSRKEEGQSVFVFAVEDGFFKALEEWQAQGDSNK